jgi:hypothetical protein
MDVEEWALAVACLSLLGSAFAIWQTRKYQHRADLSLSWDRIGLAGGVEQVRLGEHSVPFMRLTVTNHGNAVARQIDLTTDSVEIGTTQETDDGVRPYQQRVQLLPGEAWEIRIPLFRTRESFDHPVEIYEKQMMRPTVTVRWRREFTRKMQVKNFVLDGDWMTHYQSVVLDRLEDRP